MPHIIKNMPFDSIGDFIYLYIFMYDALTRLKRKHKKIEGGHFWSEFPNISPPPWVLVKTVA